MQKGLMVSLRPAVIKDSEAVADLVAQLGYEIDHMIVEGRLRDVLLSQSCLFLVAQLADSAVVGWAHAALPVQLLIGRHADLYGLVVGERWRGSGIGQKLLAAVEAWALEQGCSQMLVRSNAIRERAHSFYRTLGYSEHKRQVILVKDLNDVR